MNGSVEANRLVALLNTLHLPDHDDQLADERAGPWLTGWLDEGSGDRVAATPVVCASLRDLREGIRRLAAVRDGGEPIPDVLARATAVLRSMPVVVDLGDGQRPPGLAGVGDPGPVGRAVAATAAAYLAVHSGDEWPRLKVCAGADCEGAFLDTSRNRSRRWCLMSGCGNRAKNRVWRQRARVTTEID
jgi:predicted RNA-binding Zn ribbon-like protein